MTRTGRIAAAAAALLAFVSLASCETNPAGRTVFTGLMSSDEELRIGREQHALIVREFGGEYEDPKVRAYVDRLGQLLAQNSDLPAIKWTFTVLNSDIVNAFALPGGFVYVTSGLMALANSEAELSGVIGHEIGHVTARHTAERYSQTVLAQIGLNVLGAATGGIGQELAEIGAGAFLASYSRDQESEADHLGVRYLGRTGYDPMAMSSFLQSMGDESQLQDKLAGRSGADRYSLFATHPRAAKRVADAATDAKARLPAGAATRLGALDYLREIEGLSYGGDRDSGFVRNREFVHPKLRVRFEVPKGFRLFNSPTQVTGHGPDRARIIFDMTTRGAGDSARAYLTQWARGLRLSGIETVSIDGRDAATAVTRVSAQGGALDVRMVVIRLTPKIVYRFLMASAPGQTASLDEGFRRTAYGFKILSEAEAAKAQPYRVRLHLVNPGETAETVAARLPYDDFKLERFMVMNGLKTADELKANRLVKIVAD